MASINGWLYVSESSATFVPEMNKIEIAEFDFSILSYKEKLNSFLENFKPSKIEEHGRVKSYYFELDRDKLTEWFNRE